MNEIYLPIAEILVNPWLYMAIGSLGGVLSGLFGIGGGIILTPLLLFFGVPTPIAIASVLNQVLASSLSAGISYWRSGYLDLRIGGYLAAGGLVGSLLGGTFLMHLTKNGHVSFAISIIYIALIGTMGFFMARDSVRAIKGLENVHTRSGDKFRSFCENMPLSRYFPKSQIKASIFILVLTGLASAFFVSLIGVGGGIVIVPILTFLLCIEPKIAVGTSLFVIVIMVTTSTLFSAVEMQSNDLVLTVLLMPGGVVGAQIGVRLAKHFKRHHLEMGLSALIFMICGRFLWEIYDPKLADQTAALYHSIHHAQSKMPEICHQVLHLSQTSPYVYAVVSIVTAAITASAAAWAFNKTFSKK